jgi:hypothetical protein
MQFRHRPTLTCLRRAEPKLYAKIKPFVRDSIDAVIVLSHNHECPPRDIRW